MDPWRLVALFWAAHAAWVCLALLSLRPIQPAPAADVTVVIAARNEEARLGETLHRLQGVPTIVAEGPSDDLTRSLVASSHAILIRIDAVPTGWVGKVGALQAATPGITTTWIAFLDADVHLAPGALGGAIRAADGADLLSIYPGQRCHTVAGRAAHYALGQGMLFLNPPWLVSRGLTTTGLGQCMLIRRALYESIGRHDSLRHAIVDDVALAKAVRKANGTIVLASGTDLVESDWGTSLPAILRATRKNAFAAVGYQAWPVLLLAAVYGTLTLAGATGWMFGSNGRLASAAWLLQIVPSALQEVLRLGWGPASALAGREPWWRRLGAVLLSPAAWLLFVIVPMYSMWWTRRAGIDWRGSHYEWRDMR